MHIAMPLRADADTVFGGDTQVMGKLSAAMRACGAVVVVGPLAALPPAGEFDLLHVFNLAPLTYTRALLAWAEPAGLPVVFSPLYYASYHQWFEAGINNTGRWRAICRALGRRRAWLLYQAFQEAKLPFVKSWRQARQLLLSVTCVATSTHWENRYLARHFRLGRRAAGRMRISPLGIDGDLYGGQAASAAQGRAFRERHGLKPGYLVEVARIEPKKNQLAVIEALFDLPVPLIFVGRALPYEPEYAARCHELAARRGGVRFLEWLPEEELPLLYAGAAAHILPSWVELPGLASLEAGASGCRVISTVVSSATELLGDEAWYCDPADRASIRSAVETALSSPAPAGLRARLLAELNWRRAAEANLALDEDVLRRVKSSRNRRSYAEQ
jgi:glycosyltransferase involved in cell wall biosynthesis